MNLHETFAGTFPFQPRVHDHFGARQHYVDEGEGAPILLLHGEPTWSYLYREIIPILARRFRVIAPDMIGFGKSETPRDFDYSPRGQAAALESLVLTLDIKDITLVAHDWGGPIGGAVALRHPDRFSRLAVVNSVLPLGLPEEAVHLPANAREARYFQWMSRLHHAGIMDAVLGEFGVIIPAVMKGLQGLERPIDLTWMQAYGAPFSTPDACKGAIALPRTIVRRQAPPPSPPAAAVAALRAKPAMMIYGMRDRVLLPEHVLPVFRAGFPKAAIHEIPDAGHFVQEDAPETVARLIDVFAS